MKLHNSFMCLETSYTFQNIQNPFFLFVCGGGGGGGEGIGGRAERERNRTFSIFDKYFGFQ